MTKPFRPRKMKVLTAALGLAAGMVLTASLTGASLPPEPSAAAAPSKVQACWEEFESGDVACAPTKEDLQKVILEKYNKVVVEDAAEFEAVKKSKTYRSMPVPDGVQASYSIGTLYDDIGFSGNSWGYSTTLSMTCYGQTYTFSYPSLANNDRTSSFAGAGACQVLLYDDANYGGGFYGYYDCRSNLATAGFNDRASSVRFHLSSSYSCY